jgi:anaerobic magnesium-protoporphyrin IX monomethyl ester cyclase
MAVASDTHANQISPASLAARSRLRAMASHAPVVLITPPSIFLLDERVFMSLGILKVAAVLEQAGFAVEFLDLSGIQNFLDAVEQHVRHSRAKIVALTTTTPQLPAATKIVERIRAVRPDMRVVLGGPHVTLVHSAVKMERRAGRIARGHRALAKLETLFDVLVSGDGESAIFEAIAEGAPKLIDADDPKGPLFMTHASYDASPHPARHLVDVPSYRYTIDGHRAASLIAQLGCPFACSFCGGRNSNMLRRIRTRTTASVVAEIEALHLAHGFTGFMMYDDELNVNKNLVELMDAVAELQQRLGVEFRLRGFVKAELFTAEQAKAMYRAGFRWILCGFEAASPRILENINKKATVEDNTRVVQICHEHGLKVKALMSVGHAGESEESIRAVHDWLIDVKPDDFDCTVITTYPGTPYYDEAVPHETLPDVWTYTCKKTGDRLHSLDVDYTQVADYYKGDPDGGYTSYVHTDHLTGEAIVKLRDWVEAEVRSKLGIPFNPGAPAVRYEHSMGQGVNALPPFILRTTGSGASSDAARTHG